MHRDSSGIDSELSFEQQVALHALETDVLCLFPNPYTHLNLKYSFIKLEKVEVNYKGVHSGLFTLISHHKSILSRGEITDSAERTIECADKN